MEQLWDVFQNVQNTSNFGTSLEVEKHITYLWCTYCHIPRCGCPRRKRQNQRGMYTGNSLSTNTTTTHYEHAAAQGGTYLKLVHRSVPFTVAVDATTRPTISPYLAPAASKQAREVYFGERQRAP